VLEPYAAARPALHHGAAAAPLAGAAAGVVDPPAPPVLDTGWHTTVHRVPARRPALAGPLRRHRRLLAVLAGALLFVGALLVGMNLF